MEKRIYNVLWIDDQCNELKSFITYAELEDIHITPYNTSKDGMKAFEDNIYKWDAVILDAKCWDESADEVADTDGMYKAIEKTIELKHKRIVPVFIFSGQPDLHDDTKFLKSIRGKKLYKKGNPEDQEILFKDIKKEANKLLETQIKHKYADVINLFPEITDDLINIIKTIYNDITNDKDIFNPIRKILEWVMRYLNKNEILPFAFEGANFAACSRFLSHHLMSPYIPNYIQRSIYSCVVIGNDGSHNLDVDKAVGENKAPYLIRSTIFELLNIIYWCKSIPSDEKIIEEIKKIASSIESKTIEEGKKIEGIIEQDINRNYHCNEYLLNFNDMRDEDIGRKIRFNKNSKNTKERTKEDYPYFVYTKDIEFL